MRTTLLIVAGLLVGFLAGASLLYGHFAGFFAPAYHAIGWHGMAEHSEQHDQVSQETPGHAGHGGIAVKTELSKVPGYSIVNISSERQQLIGVRTGKIERGPLIMSIRTVGIIEPDQTRLKRIQTRIKGWVTKVHVNFVGQAVRQGDPLIEVYSPELLSTQEEYLISQEGLSRQPKQESQRRLLTAARRRLQLFGVPEDEIEQLDRTRKARDTLTLRAPISGVVLERNVLEGNYVEPATELYQIADLSVVWLQAKIYEQDLPHIEPNQPVQVSLPSQPDKLFNAQVSFVEPVLQEMTRTVKVRVEIENPDDLLKPGMYADVKVEHEMGQGLLVPESAVLRTGERAIAFRVLGEGRFEPVEVKLGSRFGDRFEVLVGLKEGDEVVTSGNFLIDSDSRLKAAVGGMGHAHGG